LERRWPERWSPTRRASEPTVIDTDDPFAEVDELARKRRKHSWPAVREDKTEPLRHAAPL
jgi:hypothetical protein